MNTQAGYVLWTVADGDYRVQVGSARDAAALKAQRRFRKVSWSVGGEYLAIFGFSAGDGREARGMVDAALATDTRQTKGGR